MCLRTSSRSSKENEMGTEDLTLKNELQKLSNQGISRKPWNSASPSEKQAYLDELCLVIRASSKLANQTIDDAMVVLRGEDWAEELYEIIPVDQIQGAYRRSLITHDSQYPINGFELINAYRNIVKSERDERESVPGSMRLPVGSADACCDRCRDTGSEIVYSDDGRNLGARTCDHRP